jgi:sec-independent protein translocase protein TatA
MRRNLWLQPASELNQGRRDTLFEAKPISVDSEKEKYMFNGFGVNELLIILVIVILLFGVGRISKVAGELGKGIKSFKDGLQGEKKDESDEENKTIEPR